jgi:hypothetical protein
MMRAVGRGILVLFFCLLAGAETLDDAVAALAKKIVARLAPAEVARVTTRNVSSLPADEAARVQPALNRALQRRVREPKPVDVAVTISENLRGYILVAEIKRENEPAVEMAEFRPATPAPAAARAAVAIESKMVWEQDAPILDLAVSGDLMLVLDTTGVSLYNRTVGKWERTASAPIPTNLRDPRGRMEVSGDALTVHLPGLTCSGSAKLASSMRCEDGGRFAAGRNTLAGHDGGGEIFSTAEIGGDTLVAELDGRTHIDDAAHAPEGVFDGWGSDFVALAGCGGRHVLASSAGDQHAADSVTLYDLVNRAPVQVSDPLEFSGPVTALWPAGEGALAVIRNLSTGKYAAYNLALDCGR